jgi:hypothetical protein
MCMMCMRYFFGGSNPLCVLCINEMTHNSSALFKKKKEFIHMYDDAKVYMRAM